MNIRAAISACFATICLTASSQTTVRDLRLDAPVDTNTIAVAYQQVTNAIATAVRLGQLDQASLARAVAVGQDLHLIETSMNGWVVGVSNIVEVDQAHIPGILFVGSMIYGAPKNGQRIDITGCDFYYDRQIPGDESREAGWGNLVTDPYLDWRLGSFFQQWGATNAAMWAALMGINNLPSSLAADLQAYSSATGQLANVSADIVSAKTSALSEMGAVRDEVNATNAVIRSAIAQALSQASGGGASWSYAYNTDGDITLADHQICVCDNGGGSYTITPPQWGGTPSHSYILFTEAWNWSNEYPSVNVSTDADYIYADEYNAPGNYWASGGMYMFEFMRVSQSILYVRVNPVMEAYF